MDGARHVFVLDAEVTEAIRAMMDVHGYSEEQVYRMTEELLSVVARQTEDTGGPMLCLLIIAAGYVRSEQIKRGVGVRE